ncbi:MAG: (2Fe-2S)-binding protein [Deltaproteobacteria bacterium]|nr:(2Fe-2S)-binding protein [Deltaproteobacteria bacterium]
MPDTLLPIPTTDHFSVVRLTRAWYVVALSSELGSKPLGRTLLGVPLVLFRDSEGQASALLDRCAHRNVPLTEGRVVGDRLECGYHGWQFDGGGACRKIPGLCADRSGEQPGQSVPCYATREQDGLIWVYGEADERPATEPYALPVVGEEGYTTVRRVVEVEASLHATLENALDVPHTAFLHRGLFRGSGVTNTIRAVVTRTRDSVQAEYLDEPRPTGVAARLLAPGGGTVTHFDRFLMPSIAQVEYRLGHSSHFLVTSCCTPVHDFRTRIHAVISFKLGLPGWLVRPILTPIAMQIFRQDARVLRLQSDAVRRFGGERFSSTEIDVLGQQIWRLLRREEKGHEVQDEDWRREIVLEV